MTNRPEEQVRSGDEPIIESRLHATYRSKVLDRWLLAILLGVFYFVGAYAAEKLWFTIDWSKPWPALFGGAALACIVSAAWLVIHRPTIRFDCKKCGKRIESNVPWVCGSCDKRNVNKPFVLKCQHCKAQPKAFECYHCGAIIFFDEDDVDPRCPARRVLQRKPGESEEDARARRAAEIEERKHAIERLEHEKRIHQLEKELERLKAGPSKPDPVKVKQEQLEHVLHTLRTEIKAAAKSEEARAEVIQEIRDNKARLSSEEIEQLVTYANQRFKDYREDIRLSGMR